MEGAVREMCNLSDGIEFNGRNDEREQTAKDMLKDKEPLAKIIKYSRLTEEKIRELAKEMKVAVM